MKAYMDAGTGTPFQIEGVLKPSPDKNLNGQVDEYLSAVQSILKLNTPIEEFQITGTSTDDIGFTHIRLQQFWQGIPVYGAEAILHKNQDEFYLYNGRTYPSPRLTSVSPEISSEEAAQIANVHAAQYTKVKNMAQAELKLINGSPLITQLVVYHKGQNPDAGTLAWHVEIVPNLSSRYSYFIDARSGAVLDFHSKLCKLVWKLETETVSKSTEAPSVELGNHNAETLPPDGPATANAPDLFGQSRLINTYEKSNTFYLIDASRPMHRPVQSNFPDDPAGVIWTIDAGNTSPENDNFQASHIISFNNSWNNPKAVSAHYNGGKAFEYFKNTFNRNSINGQGGNIISLINVVESNNTQMDNAFWNGAAMFYGNGNQAFNAPLCKALDVAGHEMSHGVIQATANLEYLGESGALNESFADIFGAMIDRNDWKMGEDVVHPGIFPSGALRDLSNPHNGGNSLNDNGWQPAHYSERYTGNQDNGGVHINSGIPNKAFQLFADSPGVGKDKAEQVYYRALTQYLVKSSKFVDCRNAVLQAANDLYGATVANAAAAAFNSVGIISGSGTNSQTDTGVNPGDDYILMTDDDYSAIFIFSPDGSPIANPLTFTAPISRPSVTDDGSVLVFIASDKRMYAITINWNSGQTNQTVIQDEAIWRNVAISKDGNRIAALTDDYDNQLWVYDFGIQQWAAYELFNPTTGQGGPTTSDVQYADVLEWDFTGEWVMYDALNRINTTGSLPIEYWDISFVRVWNNGANNFGDGFTQKLFSGLPEDVSVGNPTFAKNSDYIIAFDYLDDFNEEYYLLAANLETGDVGTIFQNTDLSWPNYSVDDTKIVFDAEDSFGFPVLGFAPVASNKILPAGDPFIYLNDKRWGVWFANGQRVLVGSEDVISRHQIRFYPNPVKDHLQLDFSSATSAYGQVKVFDLMGRMVALQYMEVNPGQNASHISMSGLPGGTYFVQLFLEETWATFKVMKK